jgi:hypothetical protein
VRPMGLGFDDPIHDAVIEGSGTPEERIGDFYAYDTDYLTAEYYPPGWGPVFECELMGRHFIDSAHIYNQGNWRNGAKFYTTDPGCNGFMRLPGPQPYLPGYQFSVGPSGTCRVRRVANVLAMTGPAKTEELKAASTAPPGASDAQKKKAKAAAELIGKETVPVYLCIVPVTARGATIGNDVFARTYPGSTCSSASVTRVGPTTPAYYLLKPKPAAQRIAVIKTNEPAAPLRRAVAVPK